MEVIKLVKEIPTKSADILCCPSTHGLCLPQKKQKKTSYTGLFEKKNTCYSRPWHACLAIPIRGVRITLIKAILMLTVPGGRATTSQSRRRQKLRRSLKFIRPPNHHIFATNFIYQHIVHLLACYFPLTILNSLKSFRHSCNLIVDELLAHTSLSLIYQLLCSSIILIKIYTQSLFDSAKSGEFYT